MTDTRKERRAPLSLKVRFKSATVDEFIEQNSSDISRGGLFIKSKKPMAVGTLLKFEFQLQDESRLIHGVGRVVWRREESTGPSSPPGMGIKFIKMDGKSRALVDSILEQRAGEAGSFEAGPGSETASEPPPEKPFFPETTPEAELPKPEDSTQVRHAREFLASALAIANESSAGSLTASEPAEPTATRSAPTEAATSTPPLSGNTEPAAPPTGMAKEGPADAGLSTPPPKVAGLFGDAKQAGPDAAPDEGVASVRPAGLRTSDSGAFGVTGATSADSDAPTGRPTQENTNEAARLAAEEALASMGQSLDDRAIRESEGLKSRPESSQRDTGTADTERPSEPGDLNIIPSDTVEAPISNPSARPSAPAAAPRVSSRSPEATPRVQKVPPLPAQTPQQKTHSGWMQGAILAVLLAAVVGMVWAFMGSKQDTDVSGSEAQATGVGRTDEAVDSRPAPSTDPHAEEHPQERPSAAEAEPAEEPSTTVEIRATSNPSGASVIHRGRQLGTTPITLTLSVQGDTEVELHLAAHQRETFPVPADQPTTQVNATLEPLPYLIEVTTQPPDARVSVRGSAAIRSPGTIRLRRPPSRDVTLTVTKSGYGTQRVVVPRTAFVEGSDALRASAQVELPEGRGTRPRPPREGRTVERPTDAPTETDPATPEPIETLPSQADDTPPPEAGDAPEVTEPVREEPPAPAPAPTREPAPTAPEPAPAPAPNPAPAPAELPNNPF